MVYVLPVTLFERLVDAQKRAGNLRPFLEKIIDSFIDVLKRPVFPSQWAQLNLFTCKAALKLCRVVKSTLDL